MLLSTIVKTIKRKSHRGSQAVTTDQITTDIIACVNEAIRDVVKLIPKRYWFKQGTIALSAGTQAVPALYSLPSDCQEAILFHYTANSSVFKLVKIDSDAEWIDKIWNINQTTFRPTYYREVGINASTSYKQIEVFPIPDGSYTLNCEYYKNKPADLTTSDLAIEIPTIPDSVQDTVEKGGLYYFLKGFDDALGMVAEKDYEKAKMSMEIADERDLDSDVRLRFAMVKSSLLPPGFTR